MILCLSPYFQKLFHYREKSSDGYYRLDMRDVPDFILVSIINYAYSGQIDITEDNIEDLIITADKYNIISIMNRCEQFLSQRLTQNNCLETYLLSHYYNCHQLKNRTVRFIIQNKVLTQQNGHSLDEESLNVETVLNEWKKQNKE